MGNKAALALVELTVDLASSLPSPNSVAFGSMREVVERDLGIRRRHSTRLLLRAARSRRRSILDGGGIDCDAEISNHGGKEDGESDLGLKISDENMVCAGRSEVLSCVCDWPSQVRACVNE